MPRHRLGGAGHAGLPGQQPDSGFQRSGLCRQLGRSLAQYDNPVTIKTIECAIVDRAWDNGWVKPEIPASKTGKKIAVVGSGPAGLACAQQLARAGHDVHLFERWAKAGGLLRYGIPDFKMEKHIIDRRVTQMEAEGVTFHYGVHVGGTAPGALDPREMLKAYDALALTGGAEAARDLPIPGREAASMWW